jgi:hypothetical protein
MARYTSLLTIAVSPEKLQKLLTDVLQSCNLDVIYYTQDYMMAKEIPGQVAFAKLVIAEVLIDKFRSTDSEMRMSFVVKNEELPIHTDNHCRRMFNLVNQAIAGSGQWHLIESIESVAG